MSYKKGDQVKIKSREWYDSRRGDITTVFPIDGIGSAFVGGMSNLCGKTLTVEEVLEETAVETGLVYHTYYLEEDTDKWAWNDYMFED